MTTRPTAAQPRRLDEVEATVSAKAFSEIGVPDQLPFGGGWRSAQQLVDPREISIDEIRKMVRRDGNMKSLQRVLALPLRTAPISFIPNEGDSSDGDEEAAFAEEALTKPPALGGMSRSLERFRAEMAQALVDGFSVHEKVWRIRDDGRAVYRKFAPRSARTCTFLLDETGGLVGVRQKLIWQGRQVDVEIPAKKLIVYTAQDESNPWYGESFFLPAYYHYDTKMKLYYIANLAYQFRAVPGRVGSIPQAAKDADVLKFRKALESIGFNSAMTKPASPPNSNAWTIDFFGQDGTMPDFVQMLNHQNAEAAKSVLAQFVVLATGTDSGAWALSKDQSDFFLMALEAILREWSEIVSFYVIPDLVDFNFGSGAYPTVSMGPLADESKQLMTEVFAEVVDAGSTQATPDFILELEAKVAEALGLPIDYDAKRKEAEIEREEEKAMAIELQSRLLSTATSPDEDEDEGGLVAASEIVRLSEELRGDG